MDKTLEQQAYELASELLAKAAVEHGDVFVVGCSSSEVCGGMIGHASSEQTGAEIAAGIKRAADEYGVFWAAQCCEHLNRALVIEKEAVKKYGFTVVCAIPQPKAGGSFATAAWRTAKEPVLVENVTAVCGLDIGQTLIGMHLRAVAVPVRLSEKMLGSAVITAARTRPKLIGGERAVYE